MKCLNTITLLLSAIAALGREGNIELERSKPIATLDIDRQLGGSHSSSKSSKSSGYIFVKSSKSHTSAKSSKSLTSTKSSKSHTSTESSKSHTSTKSSKSHTSSKSSKSSHHSAPLESQEVSSNSRDSRDVKLVEEVDFRAEEVEEVVTSQTQYSLNGGIVKDYTTATCIGIITTALLWN